MDWEIGNGRWMIGDCLERMAEIPDGSVDMVLCDLPYGTTQNKWDSVIPFEPLWREYWRVCKPNAAVVLTAAEPFTSTLIVSQIQHFKYDWIWQKSNATGHLNARRQPMRLHENILVFCRNTAPYFAQDLKPFNRTTRRSHKGSGNYGKFAAEYYQEWTNWPKTILPFAYEGTKIHPTQKPVALFEYPLRTYTQLGETVLDNTAGSGTTAIAAERSGRRWICIERDLDYSLAACDRIARHVELIEAVAG